MGENPSHFKGTERPVEQVSFCDVRDFLAKLNSQVPGLLVTLPSEGEWEYACRAGTETATYAGDLGTNDGEALSILDSIAWYRDSTASSGASEKSSAVAESSTFAEVGTQPVALKSPNAWGLYDMLGNVSEWCADHWHDDYNGAPSDGSAWLASDQPARRVGRGSSWRSVADELRAAFRHPDLEEYRSRALGFRCAIIQTTDEAKRRLGATATTSCLFSPTIVPLHRTQATPVSGLTSVAPLETTGTTASVSHLPLRDRKILYAKMAVEMAFQGFDFDNAVTKQVLLAATVDGLSRSPDDVRLDEAVAQFATERQRELESGVSNAEQRALDKFADRCHSISCAVCVGGRSPVCSGGIHDSVNVSRGGHCFDYIFSVYQCVFEVAVSIYREYGHDFVSSFAQGVSFETLLVSRPNKPAVSASRADDG
jgi:hypothetical protein